MRKSPLLLIISAVAILAIGTAGAVWYRHAATAETDTDFAAADLTAVATPLNPEDITPATGEDHSGHDHSAASAGLDLDAASAAATKPSDLKVVVEGNDPKAPRTLGSIDAPVTMIDYSSLTCPHCASAHANVLPQLIKDYVQTGKLRIVFNDFPLNQQALDGSKVARCVSNDQYFAFQTMLFSSIEQWAYSNNHPNALIQNAVLAGLPEDKARACLNDKDVEQAIMQGVQTGVQKHNVSATPTFVLNDGARTISGARPYAEFKAAIDALLPADKK